MGFPLGEEPAIARELQDAARDIVSDVDVSISVEGDATGVAELAGLWTSGAPFQDELRRGVLVGPGAWVAAAATAGQRADPQSDETRLPQTWPSQAGPRVHHHSLLVH